MKGKILLVDDEMEYRETVAKLLARRGYEPVMAPDAAQGIRLVLRGGVDVAVLDLKMPGLGGLDALRELKRIVPALPVIIVTGHLLESAEREGRKLGAFAYLTKPCTLETLIETIDAARRHASL